MWRSSIFTSTPQLMEHKMHAVECHWFAGSVAVVEADSGSVWVTAGPPGRVEGVRSISEPTAGAEQPPHNAVRWTDCPAGFPGKRSNERGGHLGLATTQGRGDNTRSVGTTTTRSLIGSHRNHCPPTVPIRGHREDGSDQIENRCAPGDGVQTRTPRWTSHTLRTPAPTQRRQPTRARVAPDYVPAPRAEVTRDDVSSPPRRSSMTPEALHRCRVRFTPRPFRSAPPREDSTRASWASAAAGD